MRRLAGHLATGAGEGVWHVVFAVMADKDIPGMLAELGATPARWYLPTLQNVARACDPSHLSGLLPEDSVVSSGVSVAESLELAVHNTSGNDKIIVFGSFFLVAEALQYLGNKG